MKKGMKERRGGKKRRAGILTSETTSAVHSNLHLKKFGSVMAVPGHLLLLHRLRGDLQSEVFRQLPKDGDEADCPGVL